MAESKNKFNLSDIKSHLIQHRKWIKDKDKGIRFIVDKGDFNSLNLSGLDFSGVVIENSNFIDCNLRNTKFSDSVLNNCKFNDSFISDANFSFSTMKGSNFTDSFIIEVNFSNSDIKHSNFSYTTLEDINFSNSNLDRTLFVNSQLHNVNFNSASLISANFTDVFFDSTYLSELQHNSIKKNSKGNDKQIESNELKIKKLESILIEKEAISQEERLKYQASITQLKKRNQELEKEIDKKKDKLSEDIEEAIDKLNSPNDYIKNEVVVHQFLFFTFILIVIILATYLIYFFLETTKFINTIETINNPKIYTIKYVYFGTRILLLISLILTSVKFAMNRRKTIMSLKERERRVKIINSSLQAINILSNSPEDSRDKVNEVLNRLINNIVDKNSTALIESNNSINREPEEGNETVIKIIENLSSKLK